MTNRFTRTDCAFAVPRAQCAAWLYRPQFVESPPLIVMAHGFGAHRSFGLPAIAERFAEAGMAVLLFDHAGLGDSAGPCRGLVHPQRQLDDWRSAIAFARTLPNVDHDQLALWGTSFSGGHVISLAAEDSGIAAIVAQVPFVDPVSTARRIGWTAVVRMMLAASWDVLQGLVTRRTFDIPVAAAPGRTGCLTTADAVPGFASIVGDEPWDNRCPARSAFAFARYRPMWRTREVHCPALVVLAEHDTLIAPEVVARAATKMNAELLRLPCGHFDVYGGPIGTELVSRQVAFLRQQFGLVSSVEWWRSRAA